MSGRTTKRAALQIPSLDGIRALSFLLVFVAHAGLEDRVPGGLGVTIFFFLSGYLITTLMRVEHAETGRISFRLFYLRRALRILPPFYAALLLALGLTALGAFGHQILSLPGIAAQALHVANFWIVRHGYDGLPPGTGVYWSLAVEEHFYLLFPLAFVLLHRWSRSPRSRSLILVAVCGGMLAWRCWLVFGAHASTDRTYLASDTRFDSILLGCALALYGNPALEAPADPAGSRKLWLRLMLPAGLALMLATLGFRAVWFRETLRYTLQGVALVPLFVCAIRYPDAWLFRPLNWRWMARIGALSYSLYLVHHFVLYALRQQLPTHLALAGILGLPVSLAVAQLFWVVLEQPCARVRRRLSARPAGEAGGPPQPRAAAGEPAQVLLVGGDR